MLNLDTHILINTLVDKLSAKEKKILKSDEWCISDIVLWEITKLSQLGRIDININDPDVSSVLAKIKTIPVDIRICQTLLKLDFKSDPADEIIAATSIVYRIPLVTRDKVIRRSKLVPLAN